MTGNDEEGRGGELPVPRDQSDLPAKTAVPPNSPKRITLPPPMEAALKKPWVQVLAVVLGIPLALVILPAILPILVGMLIAVVVIGIATLMLSKQSREGSESVDFEKLHGFKIHTGKFVRPADFTWLRLLQPNEEAVFMNRFTVGRGSDRGWFTSGNEPTLQRGRFSCGTPYVREPVAIINTSDQEFDVTVHLNPGGERMEARLRVVAGVMVDDQHHVTPQTARLVLTELNMEAEVAIRGRVQTAAQKALGAAGITRSALLVPDRFEELNRLMAHEGNGLLNEQIRPIGFVARSVSWQHVRSTLAEERRAVEELAGAGVNPTLAYIGKAIAGARGGRRGPGEDGDR